MIYIHFFISSFINFSICDFPGQIDFFDPDIDVESIFSDCGALVYIIDALDDYLESLQRLFITVTKAYKVNPELNFEVLIHKVDGLSDDSKIGIDFFRTSFLLLMSTIRDSKRYQPKINGRIE